MAAGLVQLSGVLIGQSQQDCLQDSPAVSPASP